MDAECSLRLFSQANGMFRTGKFSIVVSSKAVWNLVCLNFTEMSIILAPGNFIGWICLFFSFFLIPVACITRRYRTDAPSLFAEEPILLPKVQLVPRHSARGWLLYRKRPSIRPISLGINLKTSDGSYFLPNPMCLTIQSITYQCQG